MKPYQEVLELAAGFEAQANSAAQSEVRRTGEVAMLHRGERDAFSACAQMANDLARKLSVGPEDDEYPPDAPRRPSLRQELSRLWAFIREVDDRVTAAFDNGRAHAEYHKLFTREGSEHIYTRLDKLEAHMDSLSGANEMHAAAHSIEQDERRLLAARLDAVEEALRGAGFASSFGARQQRRRFGRA